MMKYIILLRKYKSSTCLQIILALNLLILTTALVKAALHAASDKTMSVTVNRAIWPPMKHHNIWNNDKEHLRNKNERGTLDEDNDETLEFTKQKNYDNLNFSAWQLLNNLMVNKNEENVAHVFGNLDNDSKRKSRVPVDGECLSSEGRRTGTCFNAHECHNKGSEAKGECALGFGVCCISNCTETIGNNINYLGSPNFPSFMPKNISNCIWKIKLMNNDVSQLRVDFYHFIRGTGVCDGDVFSVSGGPRVFTHTYDMGLIQKRFLRSQNKILDTPHYGGRHKIADECCYIPHDKAIKLKEIFEKKTKTKVE